MRAGVLGRLVCRAWSPLVGLLVILDETRAAEEEYARRRSASPRERKSLAEDAVKEWRGPRRGFGRVLRGE